jgi:hypothetical protein
MGVKRRALLSDPLDVLRPGPERRPKRKTFSTVLSPVTFRVPADLLEKTRDVAYWERIGVSEFCALSLRAEIARREKQRGEPYARRERELKRGRRAR